MYQAQLWTALVASFLLILAGCSGPAASDSGGQDGADGGGNADGHVHEGDDELFWHREGIELAGCQIKLGQHGIHVHTGEACEPAVSIERDGEPVANAQVFVALLDKDLKEVLVAEVATVFEPTTPEEPAHYAQGELNVPADIDGAGIRYRIVLPEDGGEKTWDVRVDVESH